MDESRSRTAPTPSRPGAIMSPMLIIIVTVVVGSVLILGVLIGASIHRESTRRQRRRLERERAEIDHDRMVLDEQRRMLDRR